MKKAEQKIKNRKKRNAVAAAGIIIFALAVTLAFCNYYDVFSPGGRVKNGILSSSEGLEDTENIPEGEVRYRLNTEVSFTKNYKKGDIMLENPANCKYDLRFTFYIESSKKLIYTSPLIKPGQYLLRDRLDKRLAPGEYKCVYTARAYDENGVNMGDTGGYLTVYIEG